MRGRYTATVQHRLKRSGKEHVSENMRGISTAVPKSTREIIIVGVAICSGLDMHSNCNLLMNLKFRSLHTCGIHSSNFAMNSSMNSARVAVCGTNSMHMTDSPVSLLLPLTRCSHRIHVMSVLLHSTVAHAPSAEHVAWPERVSISFELALQVN
jgi:hypothetical protein